jgi:hypothetical protein
MVFFDVSENIDVKLLIENCFKKGLIIMATGPKTIRAVFHFQVSADEAFEAAEIIINEITNFSK